MPGPNGQQSQGLWGTGGIEVPAREGAGLPGTPTARRRPGFALRGPPVRASAGVRLRMHPTRTGILSAKDPTPRLENFENPPLKNRAVPRPRHHAGPAVPASYVLLPVRIRNQPSDSCRTGKPSIRGAGYTWGVFGLYSGSCCVGSFVVDGSGSSFPRQSNRGRDQRWACLLSAGTCPRYPSTRRS